jgi:hypothetical protein
VLLEATMKTTFYEDAIASVYYDGNLNTVFLEYKTKVPSHREFVTINSKVLDLFKQHNTQKFVADIRKMGIIGLDSQQWIVDVLIPGLIKHLNGKDLIHAQLLDSTEVLAKVSGNNVKQKAAQKVSGFELHQFTDRESLEKFLKS